MLKFWDLGSKFLKTNARYKRNTFEIRCKISLRLKVNTFWYKTSKFLDFGSKFSKTNDRFEITTFEKVHMQNFVKTRKLVLFALK